MGTYTDVEKVKSLFRRLEIKPDTGDERSNTVITTEEVNEFIDETETILNARLSSCYDMNNVGPESITIIGVIAKFKVAQTIKNIMALTINKNSDRKQQDMTYDWGMKASKMLDDICPKPECGKCKERPALPLPDTPMLDEPPQGASLFNSANNTPQIRKGQDNW